MSLTRRAPDAIREQWEQQIRGMRRNELGRLRKIIDAEIARRREIQRLMEKAK
jgi:hypothetical protein